jgi:hypothetical protein
LLKEERREGRETDRVSFGGGWGAGRMMLSTNMFVRRRERVLDG